MVGKCLTSNFFRDDIDQRRIQLLEKRSTLQDKSAKRKVKLQDSNLFQQFDRDVTETKGWINEKLKVANDENYLDPTNLSGKLQKHQNFEVELSANKTRLDEVTKGSVFGLFNNLKLLRICLLNKILYFIIPFFALSI